jgi:hypothetical protein
MRAHAYSLPQRRRFLVESIDELSRPTQHSDASILCEPKAASYIVLREFQNPLLSQKTNSVPSNSTTTYVQEHRKTFSASLEKIPNAD